MASSTAAESMRVISGTLKPDMDVVNANRGGKERLPQLLSFC